MKQEREAKVVLKSEGVRQWNATYTCVEGEATFSLNCSCGAAFLVITSPLTAPDEAHTLSPPRVHMALNEVSLTEVSLVKILEAKRNEPPEGILSGICKTCSRRHKMSLKDLDDALLHIDFRVRDVFLLLPPLFPIEGKTWIFTYAPEKEGFTLQCKACKNNCLCVRLYPEDKCDEPERLRECYHLTLTSPARFQAFLGGICGHCMECNVPIFYEERESPLPFCMDEGRWTKARKIMLQLYADHATPDPLRERQGQGKRINRTVFWEAVYGRIRDAYAEQWLATDDLLPCTVLHLDELFGSLRNHPNLKDSHTPSVKKVEKLLRHTLAKPKRVSEESREFAITLIVDACKEVWETVNSGG